MKRRLVFISLTVNAAKLLKDAGTVLSMRLFIATLFSNCWTSVIKINEKMYQMASSFWSNHMIFHSKASLFMESLKLQIPFKRKVVAERVKVRFLHRYQRTCSLFFHILLTIKWCSYEAPPAVWCHHTRRPSDPR